MMSACFSTDLLHRGSPDLIVTFFLKRPSVVEPAPIIFISLSLMRSVFVIPCQSPALSRTAKRIRIKGLIIFIYNRVSLVQLKFLQFDQNLNRTWPLTWGINWFQ